MSQIKRACEILGSQAGLATAIGVTEQAVSQWVKAGKAPVKRCLSIEQATGGRVSCHELRPDFFPAPAAPRQEAA